MDLEAFMASRAAGGGEGEGGEGSAGQQQQGGGVGDVEMKESEAGEGERDELSRRELWEGGLQFSSSKICPIKLFKLW